MSRIGFLDMFKKKQQHAPLDLPPEPPKLHEIRNGSSTGIDEELLPRKVKPHPAPPPKHHDLPPLPDFEDDLPDLEPLSTKDHGLKSEDELQLHNLPPLPQPQGRIKHPAPPPMPPPPLHQSAPPKPRVHDTAPPRPQPHIVPPLMKPPVPQPRVPPQILKPHAAHPKALDHAPSFGDLFPEDRSPLDVAGDEKIIRDDAAFLSVLAFERVVEDLQVSKADLKHIHHYVTDISGFVGEEDKAYSAFREDIVDIQQRLSRMDKVLFA